MKAVSLRIAVVLLVLIVPSVLFPGCASEERVAQLDRESARREGERAAADYNEFYVGYARALGKTPSQLTPAERDRAEKAYRH